MLDPATKIVLRDEKGYKFEAYPFGEHLVLVPTPIEILILKKDTNSLVAEFPPHVLDLAVLAADCLAPEFDALGSDPPTAAVNDLLRAGLPWFNEVREAQKAGAPLPPPLRRWAIENGVELPSLRRST